MSMAWRVGGWAAWPITLSHYSSLGLYTSKANVGDAVMPRPGHTPPRLRETTCSWSQRRMCVLLSQPRFKEALVLLTQDFSGNII